MQQHDTIEAPLSHFCFGCSGDWPAREFQRPEGTRYVHMAGAVNPHGERLELAICCTAKRSGLAADQERHEAFLRQLGKE